MRLPSDHTLEELKRLDAGSWMLPTDHPNFDWGDGYAGEQLITLDELFNTFAERFTYDVEIKDRAEGIVEDVIGVLAPIAAYRAGIVLKKRPAKRIPVRIRNPPRSTPAPRGPGPTSSEESFE